MRSADEFENADGPAQAAALPALFAAQSRAGLEQMARHGRKALVLAKLFVKSGETPMDRACSVDGAGGADTHAPWTQHPRRGAFDPETGATYYYHEHGLDDPGPFRERGHFHLFLHDQQTSQGPAPAHVAALAVDRRGRPLGFFATNAWITEEAFRPATELIPALGRLRLDHVRPCLALNQWISALSGFYRPLLADLLRVRDEVIDAQQGQGRDEAAVLADRSLIVLARAPVDLVSDMAALDRHLAGAEGLTAVSCAD